MSEPGHRSSDDVADEGGPCLEQELDTVQTALLRNPVRRQMVHQLHRTPGLNKNQLRESLDILPETLEFHMRRLTEEGIIVERPSAQGREVLCFLAHDEELWESEEFRIMFGRRTKRQIGLYVAENPGADTAEIADAVDVEKVTVRHHLRTLREHDLIRQVRLGRTFEYHPSDILEEWTEIAGQGFPRSWTQGSDDGS